MGEMRQVQPELAKRELVGQDGVIVVAANTSYEILSRLVHSKLFCVNDS